MWRDYQASAHEQKFGGDEVGTKIQLVFFFEILAADVVGVDDDGGIYKMSSSLTSTKANTRTYYAHTQTHTLQFFFFFFLWWWTPHTARACTSTWRAAAAAAESAAAARDDDDDNKNVRRHHTHTQRWWWYTKHYLQINPRFSTVYCTFDFVVNSDLHLIIIFK